MALEYSYFRSFPKINYLGCENLTNILIRTKILEDIRDEIRVFLPYVVKFDERPEDVAFNYYDDAELDWLVYMSNDIIDPYYQWPISYNDLLKFLKKKYGSISTAQSTIHEYKNNDDETIRISPDSYSYQTVPGDWTAITKFDYEDEQNENKRNIVLLDKRYTTLAINNLKDLLNS